MTIRSNNHLIKEILNSISTLENRTRVVNYMENVEPTIKTTKKKSIVKSFFKKLLDINPFDPFAAWSREQMKKIGVLEIFDDYVYWVAGWNTFRYFFNKLWKYNVKGRANFPEYGPSIVIGNHQSELDPFLIGSAVQKKVQWVSKVENFDIPIFKSIIKPFGTLSLVRGSGDNKAMDQIKAVLENDGSIGIFPEGTRSSDGKLADSFRSGAARIAIETGAPYVPIALIGAYKVLPKTKDWTSTKLFGKNTISVRVGKPVYVDPDVKLTYENSRFIAAEMRKDLLLLLEGKVNESRVIRMSDILAKPEEVKVEEVAIEETAETDPLPAYNPGFDPASDYSIS
jgi:1-acyl-sn-glycerol-3-phosphate acyltransferase